MGPTALNRPLSDEEMEELERQSAGSTGGFDAFNPPASRPLSDAELDAVEMREGAGTALQQTPFGQATDQAAPQPIAPDRPLSDDEMDDLADETVRDPSYIPTFNEWDEWDQKRAARSSSVEGFLRGAGSIAQALGSVAYSVAATPGNFVMRGFGPAYDTLVHSSAEGMRRAGVGIAEMITWAGDTAADIRTSAEREAALDGQLRKQMAEQNAFTGNAQADAQIFAQAKEKARADGFYELTQDQKSADRREQYDRFVRGRALEQEFLGIGNFTMGNDPIATGNLFGPKFVGGQPSQITAEATTKTDYGIDDSKVDEGIATGVMIAGDPSGWLPLGAGALNKVKALRRLAVIADRPMGWTAGKLGRVARLAEDIEAKALSAGLTTDRMARASGAVAIGAGAIGISQNNDLAKGIAAAATILPAVKYSGKILRRAEGAALAGQMVAKEMGVGGVGVLRADSASRLAENAAIPGRYRDAMRGFFSGPESSLKRASQNEALPLSARQTMARLDRAGATQAFRIADDAVSGALAGSVVGVPFAAITPEDKQAEIFGSIATMGALGGAISGPLTRRAQMADADVARMLADIEAVGGDAVTFAQLPHDKLVRLAAMQGVVSSKVDFVPLRADEYTANEVLNAKNATTTKGLYVDAEDGNRPRIFINIDQLAAGDVTGHEIGHAILKSDILGGEIKNNMRNLVNVQYGQDGVVARGREYATKMLADQVEQGVTGIKPEVLTDAEMAQVARGAKPEDIIRSRWQDKDMRERMINERIDEMNQRDMASGGMEYDWARDEIAAETFSGLSGGIDFRNIRQSGPMAAALGAFSGTLDMMGARFRGNGRLETPNRLFEENPLMDTPQMRKAVADYTKAFDRYLVGMERDAAPKRRGTKVAPTGRASEAARSPHNRVYKNGNVEENDIFTVDANGNMVPKSQQQIDTQERARAATLKSINNRTKFVPVHSAEWGARKVGNRVEVGGPNLPIQFDHFVQIPEWLRLKAREFEAKRKLGQSYRISYNAIGTGVTGSYKIKNLGNVEAITREMVPFGYQLSEKNNLLVKAIDLDAFRAAAIRAVDRGELPDFGNNVKQVEADLKVLLKNYEDGRPGETGIGVLKKNILNGLLGTGTAVQKAANPLYAELNPKGSIRTFRFDRLNYADAYATGYFPHYHKINTNALPREAGVMSLDEWRQFDADRKATWLNNRARERGYTNATNWANSDEAGFAAASDEYRKLFPRPDNNNRMPQALPREAMGMPDAAASGRGQAMPDITITPDEARRRGLVGPVYHGSPDFKGRKFDPKYRARSSGISRGGFSFSDDVASADSYAAAPIDSAQAAVDSANDVMREAAGRMERGLKIKGFSAPDELPEFNVRYVDDISELSSYFNELAKDMPGDLADRLRNAAKQVNEPANPVVVEAYLRNPKTMDIDGKKLWLVDNPDDIFVSAARPPQGAATGRTRGQAMPDVVHDDNYTLSPQVPDRGYYIIGTKPTADGRVLEYHVDPRTTMQPRVAGIDSIGGEQVAMLEADRHNTRGDNMGGPLHPFLINNQTVVYLPDGRGYKPVWANMNSGFVTRAKNIVKNTTAGHALIQIMKENAHRSNRKFVMDVTSEIDARRASMSDDQADFLHVLLELGAINPQGRINQAYNRVKRLSDEALENRAPMSELAEAQRQYDVTFEKYGPMAEFLARMGPLKNHSTRGRMKEFQGEFDSLMSKYRNAPWFSSMASKYRNTKFVDEAARFSFKQRGAAMDRITGIPFAPDVKKMLDDSMDFVNGKNLDIVGVVQLSKDEDAFAVYFGKNAKEEAKMSSNERLLRDQLLASGTFRPHPSYDWVMLGPENADSFILKTPADPLKLFPDYAKNHPNPKVRGGTKETIAGTMKKSKIPLILK